MKREWIIKGTPLLKQIENTRVAEDELALWYLGQCGFLVKSKTHSVLIDPVLTDLKDDQGKTKREYPAPFDPERLNVEAVFCTHGHRDHANIDTLLKLYQANPGLIIVVPAGLVDTLSENGIPKENLLGLNAQEVARKGDLRIVPVQTAHPEYTRDEADRDLNLAWYLDFDGISLLHLGDTYLKEKLITDLQDLDEVDILMTPINGQDYFRTARGCIGNLSGYESAKLASIIQSDLTIPCHYDMMKGNTCRPTEFLESMASEYPKGKVALPGLGERIIYRKDEKAIRPEPAV